MTGTRLRLVLKLGNTSHHAHLLQRRASGRCEFRFFDDCSYQTGSGQALMGQQ